MDSTTEQTTEEVCAAVRGMIARAAGSAAGYRALGRFYCETRARSEVEAYGSVLAQLGDAETQAEAVARAYLAALDGARDVVAIGRAHNDAELEANGRRAEVAALELVTIAARDLDR